MDKALEDVKVLDLTHVQAGPSCTQMLGFLGADVIKVEDTSGGDSTRADTAHREDSDSFYFLIFNNNKRGITLNLKTDRGKELFEGLLKWADVLVENYSLGMLDRLGLGWDVLQEISPGLVYAPIKGFGTEGDMGLAGATVAESDDVVGALDVLASCQLQNQSLVQGRHRQEVEGVEALGRREAGCFDPTFHHAMVTVDQLQLPIVAAGSPDGQLPHWHTGMPACRTPSGTWGA